MKIAVFTSCLASPILQLMGQVCGVHVEFNMTGESAWQWWAELAFGNLALLLVSPRCTGVTVAVMGEIQSDILRWTDCRHV